MGGAGVCMMVFEGFWKTQEVSRFQGVSREFYRFKVAPGMLLRALRSSWLFWWIHEGVRGLQEVSLGFQAVSKGFRGFLGVS